MKEELRADLAAADPVPGGDARAHDLVQQMIVRARDAAAAGSPASRPPWRRRRTLIPLGIAGVVVLTGAAVVIPLTMGINGTRVEPDALIPIVYTTDTGVEVSCRYGIYFGDPASRSVADEEMAAFVAEHDWTGIGQRIYEDAIAHPFIPGRDGGLDVDTPQRRDEMSLVSAISRSIADETPDHLRSSDPSSTPLDSGITDCTGRLH